MLVASPPALPQDGGNDALLVLDGASENHPDNGSNTKARRKRQHNVCKRAKTMQVFVCVDKHCFWGSAVNLVSEGCMRAWCNAATGWRLSGMVLGGKPRGRPPLMLQLVGAGWGALIRTWPLRAQPRPWPAASEGTTRPQCRPAGSLRLVAPYCPACFEMQLRPDQVQEAMLHADSVAGKDGKVPWQQVVAHFIPRWGLAAPRMDLTST